MFIKYTLEKKKKKTTNFFMKKKKICKNMSLSVFCAVYRKIIIIKRKQETVFVR